MNRFDLYQQHPELREVYDLVDEVEFNNATTGLISSKGYTVRFYNEWPVAFGLPQVPHFAAVTITLKIGETIEDGTTISSHHPEDWDGEMLKLYAIVAIREYRVNRDGWLRGHRPNALAQEIRSSYEAQFVTSQGLGHEDRQSVQERYLAEEVRRYQEAESRLEEDWRRRHMIGGFHRAGRTRF